VEETIHNPVLKGFNPDPSIIRVEDDYYIATSTFQWFPGVQIHHSRDLINWQLLTRPLDRIKQLNMKAVPDSAGICKGSEQLSGNIRGYYRPLERSGLSEFIGL
jgi:xylan 1,4-beta-xylosidase